MFIGNKRRLSISIVLVATIVLSAVALLTFARTSFGVVGNTVTIGSDTVQPGQSISVPVDAFVSPDLLGAATIEVDYDPSVVDAVSCAPAAGSCNLNKDHDGVNPDTVAFNFANISGVSGNIHLADITFQAAVGQQGQSSELDVRIIVFVDTNGQPIAVADVDGQIDVLAAPTPSPVPSTPTPTAVPATPTATPILPTSTPTATATPTPTATATASPSLTSTPGGGNETNTPTIGPSLHPWGDIDCSGEINPIDALKLLRADAGLSVSQAPDCPRLGDAVLLN